MNFKDLLQQLCSGLALSSSELQHIFDFWLSFLLNDSSTQFRTTAAMEMFTLGDIKDSVVQKKAYYENSVFCFWRILTGKLGRRNASLSLFSLTKFSWGRALMRSSGNFLNNTCHRPEWLTLSSWLILFNKDTIRIWSNWFEFLRHFEEIFCKSGKHILMPFPCISQNESWSARALKALRANFIAILGAGREGGRTRSWVGVQEH